MTNVNDRYGRNISYVNKDFAEFRLALISLAKNYFPQQYADFAEASPAMMMLEAASYVGDALGFFADTSLQESLLYNVEERINLYNLAQSLGYKAKTVTPSSVDLEIFQLIPSIGEGNSTKPDFRYALFVNPEMQVSTTDTDAVFFYTKDAVDFRFSSSYDPTTITTYSVTDQGEIEYYLLKKKVKAISGTLKSLTFPFADPKLYDKIVLQDNNITEIVKVTDSDNNIWYEVPYLAQDLVQIAERNMPYNDPVLAQYRSSVPYTLCYKQTERRFVTRLRKDDFLEIQFGGGMSSEADEEIVPNPMNVGLGLDYFERVTDVSIDPMNFLYTKTYGSAPNNTSLVIQYSIGSGLIDNVKANSITQIVSSSIVDPADSTDSVILQTIKDSLSVNNPNPAFGGQNRKPLDVIREEAIANFAAQNRAVTKEDYILRTYSMPAKFGAVCKAYAEQDTQINRWNEDRIPNPFAINLYVLSYDANKNFVTCNEAIKENLRTYLRQYRLMTDAVNLKDPYIINIGAEIEIISRPNQNSNEVILRVLNKLIELLDNDKMQINQPIIISNLTSQLDRVEGVQSISSIKFVNLINMNEGYSGNVYDLDTATRNGIIYPPVDPAIFSVQFPKRDLKIRVADV